MARKKAALTVVEGAFAIGRPPPPVQLTDRQRTIWKDVVETEAAELFATSATRNLLADYCRHRETAETYSALVEAFDPEWLKTADGLDRFRAICRGRDVETRASVTLATKLRLTNQSRATKGHAATIAKGQGVRPWEA